MPNQINCVISSSRRNVNIFKLGFIVSMKVSKNTGVVMTASSHSQRGLREPLINGHIIAL